MRRTTGLALSVVALLAVGATPAGAVHNEDLHRNMTLEFSSQNATNATNSDLAFWGDRAYAGNYDGFRIFDISDPTDPELITDFRCHGPQNDPSVWDTDGDGSEDLLILSVDRTLAGPECGAPPIAHDDPSGWEGVRLFDVSDPANPVFIKGVYQDCGSHTNTIYPDAERDRLLVLNSSYPLRPGPTCGEVRGPEAGRDPLHGVMQVIGIPLDDPSAAAEVAELPIDYPGDPDNKFDPDEHALPGFGDLRACHDQAVFLPRGLVLGACAEQSQLWRIDPATGLPDTQDPIWVYDDTADTDGPGGGDVGVDFWHSATFAWDGKIVNLIDESFGGGCPTTTPGVGDTGRMFFLSTETGQKLSHFGIDRNPPGDVGGDYCSAHLGTFVPMPGRRLLVNSWYRGGADVIDATDPRNPREIAFYDRVDADNWTAYWYERNPHPGSDLTIYGTDGVHDPATGIGFEAFTAAIRGRRIGLDHLNPQLQERVIRSASRDTRRTRSSRASSSRARKARTRTAGQRRADARRAVRRLAP